MKDVIIREGMVYLALNQISNGEKVGETEGLPSWVEYIGDVNPFEHGGTIYIEEDDTQLNLRFLHITHDDNGNILTSDGLIDLTDGWLQTFLKEQYHEHKVGEEAEEEFRLDNRFELADRALGYFAHENFGGSLESRTIRGLKETLKDFYGYSFTFYKYDYHNEKYNEL